MASELRRLKHIRGLALDEFNDWADKRDDAARGSPERAHARAVATAIEKAIDDMDKAIRLAVLP